MKLRTSATVQGRVQHSAAMVMLLQALQHTSAFVYFITNKVEKSKGMDSCNQVLSID